MPTKTNGKVPQPWSMRAEPTTNCPTNELKALNRSSRSIRNGRVLWWIAAVSFALAALCVMVSALLYLPDVLFGYQFGWLLSLLMMGAFPLGCIGLLSYFLSNITIEYARIRCTKLIVSTRGQLCPVCMFDLSGRSRNDHQCTECGHFAPRRECVRLWCKFIRSRP